MIIYTLDAVRCEVIKKDDGEGNLIEMIELEIAVLRDGAEINRFDQRYGINIDNTELREHIVYRVKEIIAADYDGIKRTTNKTRCSAIAANIEAWSVTLP